MIPITPIHVTRTVPKVLVRGNVRVENRRMDWDNPYYNIVEIDHNTQKEFGDQKKFAITQSPVKDHQIMLIRKTHYLAKKRKA